LAHGQWLPWLKANAEVLGFKADRTARLLMRAAANRKLASDLNEATAVALNRLLWGHADSRLIQQSLSNEHYTPQQYLAAAREVLGFDTPRTAQMLMKVAANAKSTSHLDDTQGKARRTFSSLTRRIQVLSCSSINRTKLEQPNDETQTSDTLAGG
jgi:hypothetical protein